MNVAARRVTLLALFSAKSKCTVSFRLKKSPLSSNKAPQNVANRLQDAIKLLKVHFMFKLKVELEIGSVCYIRSQFRCDAFGIIFCKIKMHRLFSVEEKSIIQ